MLEILYIERGKIRSLGFQKLDFTPSQELS